MDFYTATKEELIAYGFYPYASDLCLCPLKKFNELPDGITLYSIFGNIKIKGRDHIDLDERGGLIAFGIIPGKTRSSITKKEVKDKDLKDIDDSIENVKRIIENTGLFVLSEGRFATQEEATQIINEIKAEIKEKIND